MGQIAVLGLNSTLQTINTTNATSVNWNSAANLNSVGSIGGFSYSTNTFTYTGTTPIVITVQYNIIWNQQTIGASYIYFNGTTQYGTMQYNSSVFNNYVTLTLANGNSFSVQVQTSSTGSIIQTNSNIIIANLIVGPQGSTGPAVWTVNSDSSIYYNGGNVGIGLNNPTYKLQLLTDSAAKPGTNTWTISSDERLKDNIILADNERCIEIIKLVPLKHYKWKDNAYTLEQVRDRSKLGWIAQDVEKVFPKAVNKNRFIYNQVFQNIINSDGSITKKLISEDVIEDCRELNSDQIYAVMYGAIQKLIANDELKSIQLQQQATDIAILQQQVAQLLQRFA